MQNDPKEHRAGSRIPPPLGLAAAVAPAGTATRGKMHVLEAETLSQAAKAGIDAERAESG